MCDLYRQIFIGSVIDINDSGEITYSDNVGIFVDAGKIVDVTQNPDEQKIADFKPDEINILSPGQFMIPGFIDCHTCAVQFPNLGLGYDKTFLDWLETYTYPLEKQYTDLQLANKVFGSIVQRTIQAGTTTACYYASLYTEASTILAQKCSDLGQRAFIGKLNMNVPRDDGYYENTEKSIQNTRAFIEAVERLENPLVRPIITPRFALSCDMELMQQVATIALEKDLLIQSTISQSKDEVQAVKDKFHKATYADVYNAAGLLTSHTTLAHGIHLEDSELNMLANKEITIIHCPTSNINLKSGLCDVRKIMSYNIDIDIGTDISGGSNYSMLNEIRAVLNTSTALSLMEPGYVPFNYKDVFLMATLGGARALAMADVVGSLKPYKEFDALIIDLNAQDSFLDDFKQFTLDEKLQRFIYCGTFNNIISVYVKGRKIK